jgi:hypothetical protein
VNFALRIFAVLLAVAVAGCATRPPAGSGPAPDSRPQAQAVLRSLALDRATEDRILALDPQKVSAADVRTTLARAPAPHIVLLHGGIFPVHLLMTSAGRFLAGMGYPEGAIRNPGDERWSHSPYEYSDQIAGMVAWHYEHDGLRPMLIGHSQGGIQAVKVLYDLAGAYGDTIPVWNPVQDAAEDRTTIVDPLTGRERPVIGVTVSYASAVAAGGAALLLPNQWSMVLRARTIPDTVDEFTGFAIGLDLVAWTFSGSDGTRRYRHNGTAEVRNVLLPASYSHVFVPLTHPLARDPAAREWIDAYVPAAGEEPPAPPDGLPANILWAADVWYSVKKHWVLEAQRLIRARRAALGPP